MSWCLIYFVLYVFIFLTEWPPIRKIAAYSTYDKTGFSPPVTLCYWSFQGDTSVVILFALCLGV